ncbi:MAG TPA: YihY/virulence factor BrkB family protein [Chitinophagaceae bacterium]|nr:YihY/virulence factor BrkB family protein [Chitinophagaceae bacterium]
MIKLARIILNLHPLRYLSNKSKKWILPGFQGIPLYEVIKFFRKQLRVSGLTERASAISFNFIMSIPPTCLFLFTLIPNLPFIPRDSIKAQLHNLIIDMVPAATYNRGLIDFVDFFFKGSKIGILSFGFILLLFFASNAMMGVMRSFNKNYPGFEKRKGLLKRWVAIKLTIILYSLLLVCLVLLFMQSNILKKVVGVKNVLIRDAIVYGKWIFIIALIFYSFAFVYKYAPSIPKRWKLVSPGAIIATSLSIIATLGFSIFLNNFDRYNILYGSIGTIIALGTLIFINSLIMLIGFEFNVSINALRAMAELRKLEEKQEPVHIDT